MFQHYYLAKDIETEDLGGGIQRRVLAYEENLMIVEVFFEEGAVGALHSHPHEQITYILEGEFEFDIGGEKKILKAGDSAYKEPEMIHGAVCLKKGKLLDVFTPHREDFVSKDK